MIFRCDDDCGTQRRRTGLAPPGLHRARQVHAREQYSACVPRRWTENAAIARHIHSESSHVLPLASNGLLSGPIRADKESRG